MGQKIINIKDWLKIKKGVQFEVLSFSNRDGQIEEVRRIKDGRKFYRERLEFDNRLATMIIFKEFYSDMRRVRISVACGEEKESAGKKSYLFIKVYEVCIDDIEINDKIVIKNGAVIEEKTIELNIPKSDGKTIKH